MDNFTVKNIHSCISKDDFDVMVNFFLWLKNVRDLEVTQKDEL